jgi:23S rRNA-/tRNA-specific pseudouridylate synthase
MLAVVKGGRLTGVCGQAIPEAISLDIVYEDSHLMVVNKVWLCPLSGVSSAAMYVAALMAAAQLQQQQPHAC